MKVLKSQVGDQALFASAVETYRQAMLAHRFTVDEPAPTAHPLVEACIRRVQVPEQADDFVADYEYVNDITPAHVRQELINKSRQQEAKEIGALMSPGARRLFELELTEAMSKKIEDRTAEDEAIFARQREFQAAVRKVQLAGAKREVAIEAMTDEQVAAA